MTPDSEESPVEASSPLAKRRAPAHTHGRNVLSDPARIETLHRLNLLDVTPEPVFDRLVQIAHQLLGAPVSLITMVDDEQQYFKAAVGLDGSVAVSRKTPLSHSFCQHVVTSGRPLIVDDARINPLVRENLAVRDLSVIAYLGVPIISPEGFVLGSFCVIDAHPREWKPVEVAFLQEFSRLITFEIAARERHGADPTGSSSSAPTDERP